MRPVTPTPSTGSGPGNPDSAANARREDAGLDSTKNLRGGGLDASSGTVLLFA